MQYRPILSKAGNYIHRAAEIMLLLLAKKKKKRNSEPYDRDMFYF